MSQTLPPVTGTGVSLQFVFPFDRSMPRGANVVWRSTVGGRSTDVVYAEIEQGGDSSVVHEQVTFPGDTWAVVEKGSATLLALHVATGEREQRVVITSDSRRRCVGTEADHGGGDLSAAVGATLSTPTLGAATAAFAPAPTADAAHAQQGTCTDNEDLRAALALSRRLADECRAAEATHQQAARAAAATRSRTAEDPAAAQEKPDAEAMRQARLRRFASSA